MLGGHLLIVLVVLWASLAASKPVQFSKKIAVMDEKDKIVGYTSHVFFRDDEAAYPNPPVLPVPPMNTNSRIMAALQTQFPVGSPNITVSDPWVKKAETCTWTTDSNLVHHFEDTVYEPTNDICSLSPGEYTWIVTSDYQISIGRFPNTYEFTSKHANLALMRTGYVAGELAIIPATPNSKAMKGWNLLSGTYSIPISESQNPNDPMAYLENVLYPKMNAVFSLLPCAPTLKYGGDNEFFPDLLPSARYIQGMCADNYYVKYENALTWKSDGSSVCVMNNPNATCVVV